MRTIPPDYLTQHEVVVSDAMTVDFEDRDDPRLGRLHPVYATYWMTKHMELVSRKIILPFLEEGEEGIGHEVSVTHHASALPGMRVILTARFLGLDENRVRAACRAVNELGDVAGTGTTTQVIVPHERLARGFERLSRRWAAHLAAARPHRGENP